MPHARRQDLYWLAVSAAFGHISNFTITGLGLPKGHIMIEYNSELNHVRFYCRQISTWAQVWYNLRRLDPLGRLTTQVMGGPKEDLKGGAWQWFGGIGIGGLPTNPADFGRLGWENETILTKNATYRSAAGQDLVSYNPYPDGDEQSRGPATIASDPAITAIEPGYGMTRPEYLLFQALSPPCNPNLTTPIPPSFPTPIPPGTVSNPGALPAPGVGPTGPDQTIRDASDFGGGGDF
jgi:hypothetical protein